MFYLPGATFPTPRKLTRRGDLSSVIHNDIEHAFNRSIVVVKAVRSRDGCQRVRCQVSGGPEGESVDGDFFRGYIMSVTSVDRNVVSSEGLQDKNHEVVNGAAHIEAPGRREVQEAEKPAHYEVSNQVPGGES